ncbi:MAG: biotin transporter BioY [Corynebacterium sp.]|nr:biotin transporter BioY [Corynebacterium sp.]
MKATSVYNLTLIAVCAAIITILAFVAIPIGALGVPLVLQNTVVIAIGMLIGAKRGTLAVLLWLALGLIGLPVMAGGRSLWAALAGPTVGYIVGYVLAAAVAGAIAYRVSADATAPTRIGTFIVAGAAGILIEYAAGVVGLVLRAGQSVTAAILAQGAFILPDIAETVVMVTVALAVHRALPQLRRPVLA